MTSSLEKAPFSGKGIAPFLDRESPERKAASMRALFNPSHRHETELLDVIKRLAIKNVPLA